MPLLAWRVLGVLLDGWKYRNQLKIVPSRTLFCGGKSPRPRVWINPMPNIICYSLKQTLNFAKYWIVSHLINSWVFEKITFGNPLLAKIIYIYTCHKQNKIYVNISFQLLLYHSESFNFNVPLIVKSPSQFPTEGLTEAVKLHLPVQSEGVPRVASPLNPDAQRSQYSPSVLCWQDCRCRNRNIPSIQ